MDTVAVLIIPSGNRECNLEPNGVSYFRIYNTLKTYENIIMLELMKDGKNRFGDNDEKVIEWIKKELQKDQICNDSENHLLN